MENHLTPYQSVIIEIKSIISSGQEAAYSASSKAMLLTYWNIGKRIVEQELGSNERAEYGLSLIHIYHGGDAPFCRSTCTIRAAEVNRFRRRIQSSKK